MIDLELELRHLSKDQFESLIHQYLVTQHPGVDIKRVEGKGGDGGIDGFAGMLAHGPAIWQSKHFADRIKRPQQKQILESIKTALRNAPSLWVLCVPINLRRDEHKWFEQEVVLVYGKNVRIELIQASNILTGLINNHNLRNAFFPENFLSGSRALNKFLTHTDGLSQEQVSLVAGDYVQQYASSLSEIEPRLKPVLTYDAPAERRNSQPPGVIMSVTEGNTTIDYYPGDVKALKNDPIRITIQMAQEQLKALETAI